jgi:tRNA1Val (adenine37-N6)-methyltransferase
VTANAVTEDTLMQGRIRFFQPVRGYRTSIDPVLLSGFLGPPHGRFLEIGAGCGLLSFLLLLADPECSGDAIEIQPTMADLAARGVIRNGLQHRLQIIVGDARKLTPPVDPYDTVVCNPPYRSLGSGTLSENEMRRLSNHEVTLSLDAWSQVAFRMVSPKGRVGAVFPAEREVELFGALHAAGLFVRRFRRVRPSSDRPPMRLLVEAQPGTGPVPKSEADLCVHEGAGFGAEVRRMLGEPA